MGPPQDDEPPAQGNRGERSDGGEGGQEGLTQGGGGEDEDQEKQEAADEEAAAEAAAKQAAAEAAAEELTQEMRDAWRPALDALDAADSAFDGQLDMLEGQEQFDLSAAAWHQTGWAELQNLTKRLAKLREIRELVRKIGRGAGKGPIRRNPRRTLTPLFFSFFVSPSYPFLFFSARTGGVGRGEGEGRILGPHRRCVFLFSQVCGPFPLLSRGTGG